MRISDCSSDVCSSDLFGEQHAQVLGAQLHLEIEQLFDGEHIAMLHAHRRDVIETVDIGQGLKIGFVFHQLFGAAMEQADVRIDPLDDFAVHLEHQPQDAMRGGVLRSEIDHVIPDPHLVGGGRSEEHTSELQSIMRTSYDVFCLKKKNHI